MSDKSHGEMADEDTHASGQEAAVLIRPGPANFFGGAVILAFGLWFGIRALDLQIGTARQMGPGYFPLLLSAVAILLGAAIMLQGILRSGERLVIEWRPLIFVSVSVLGFAAAMRYFGLMPAVMAAIVIAALADPESRFIGVIALAITASIFAWLIFALGLGLALPAFRF